MPVCVGIDSEIVDGKEAGAIDPKDSTTDLGNLTITNLSPNVEVRIILRSET